MAPSKRWMDLVDDRLSEAYETGVQSFLNYAFKRTGKNKEIRCPCVKCGNTYSETCELVESHLKVYRIVQIILFGIIMAKGQVSLNLSQMAMIGEEIEEDESDNEMHEIIRDLYPEFSDVGRDFENSNSMSNDEIEEEPNDEAKKFYRFQIEGIDKGLRTQNSGVVVVGDTGSETERRDYYGVLTEIIELQYLGGRRVVLFRCNWWDVYNKEKEVKIDEYGHISVNCQRLLKTNEPFVLANQASQVFYASDNVNKGWHIVQKTQTRDIYEMPLEVDEDSNDLQNRVEAYQQFESFISINAASTSQNMDDEVNWNRKDMEPMIIDITSTRKNKKQKS
uniref:DUF4216 domain-containing protein n=1 Tax=Ananas comosus var. bracteatus TaxID=296719 RepID=A0A6V7QBV5_ANACO|nr:unnamed protein product [Ananas comosus var. bracteatus]